MRASKPKQDPAAAVPHQKPKQNNVWGGLKSLVASTTKKLEQSVDTVLNKIDGIDASYGYEPDIQQPTKTTSL